MAILILSLAQGVFCAYVLVIATMVLNAMSRHTRHGVRWSYLMIIVASLDGLVTATSPTLQMCLMSAGIALFLANNERRGQHASQR